MAVKCLKLTNVLFKLRQVEMDFIINLNLTFHFLKLKILQNEKKVN